ncbi:MAG: hypothetical protein KIS66_07530 [Fimbriimonadaceae bacterium]|nr:hypothetical protein [Fimbriimonadaceae bacterium]
MKDWLRERADDNGQVNWEAYDLGVEQAEKLPEFRLRAPGLLFPGNSWSNTGPYNMDPPQRQYWGLPPVNGRVSAIAYHPTNANTIYVGSGYGGLFKSTDGGSTFTPLSDRWDNSHVSCIVVDASVSPERVFVGTGDYADQLSALGRGVWSYQQGSGWTQMDFAGVLGGTNYSMRGYAIRRIVMDPANSANLLVVTGSNGGGASGFVWRSTNSGVNFEPLATVPAGDWSGAVVGRPDAGNVRSWFVVGRVGGAARLYRSRDSGATFSSITLPTMPNGTRNVDIAASSVNGTTLYLLNAPPLNGNLGRQGSIWRSTDANAVAPTFSNVTSNFPNLSLGGDPNYNWSQTYYDFHIHTAANGANDTVFVGLIDLAVSTDSGANWQSVGQTSTNSAIIHNDQHSFAVNPTNANQSLVGCDGSLYRCVYTPATGQFVFTNLGATLNVSQFYAASFHPTDVTRVLGGLQDNGTAGTTPPLSNGNLNLWDSITPGDGGGCLIMPHNPLIQYSSGQSGGLYRTTNSWQSQGFFQLPVQAGDTAGFVSYMAADPTEDRIYVGTAFLHTWTPGAGWTNRIGNAQLSGSGGQVRTIVVSPSNNLILYAGTTDGFLYRIVRNGANFTVVQIDSNLPNRGITGIAVHPSNPNDLLVSMSGTQLGTPNVSHLYRCPDTTVGAPVWTAVDNAGAAGLPQVPANTVARDPDFPNSTWYVGTDIGAFATQDGGATWARLSGLPQVQISQIEVNPTTYRLNVATWGRGMWSVALVQPNYDITVAPAAVAGGESVAATITMTQAAPPGGATFQINYGGALHAQGPASVTVPAGATTTTFGISTTATANGETVNVSAFLGPTTVRQTSFRILVYGASVSLSQGSAWGGHTVIGTAHVGLGVNRGDVLVQVTSDRPDLVTIDPTSFVIPAGYTDGTFTILPKNVPEDTWVNITVTATNGASGSQSLLIRRYTIDRFSVDYATIWGGHSTVFFLGLDHTVGAYPLEIQLTTTEPNQDSGWVNNKLTINGGYQDTSGVFTAKTVVPNDRLVTWKAKYATSELTTAYLVKKYTPTLLIDEGPVWGGHSLNWVISLDHVVGIDPVQIALTTTETGITDGWNGATPTINGGYQATSGTFTVNKLVPADRTVTYTATHLGNSNQDSFVVKKYTHTLDIDEGPIWGGHSLVWTINLDQVVGSVPVVVSLTSPETGITDGWGGATPTINGGYQATSGVFTVNKLVPTDRTVTYTATHLGNSTQDSFVLKRYVATLLLQPWVVVGGEAYVATVLLDQTVGGVPVDVVFTSSAPAYATAPPAMQIIGGTTGNESSGSTSVVTSLKSSKITADIVGADAEGWLTVVPVARVVTGRIAFGDWVPAAPTPVAVTMKRKGEAGTVTVQNVVVGPDGSFTMTAWAGEIDLYLKPRTWLRAKATVDVRTADATGLDIALLNGDVDGNNSVNIADFLAVRNAFGSTPTSANWNPNADLNGNGAVNIQDFLIVRRNLGRSGVS